MIRAYSFMCSHLIQSVTPVLPYTNVISLANLEEASTRIFLENQSKKESRVSDLDLSKLHSALKRHKYKFRPQQKISFYEAEDIGSFFKKDTQTKERIFAFPSKKDTIVLTAFAQKLEQVFDPLFSPSSYGFRKDRDLHTLFCDLSAVLMENPSFFRIHIEKTFGKVHQEILLSQLTPFCDQQGRELFQKICQASYIDIHSIGADFSSHSSLSSWSSYSSFQKKDQVPLANSLSCLCTNIFFHSFDKFLEALQDKHSFSFVRYMDQVLCVVSGDLQENERIELENRIQRYLLHRLKLSSRIEKAKKISFLGVELESRKTGVSCSPDIQYLFSVALEKGYAKYGASGKIRATSFRQATSFQEDQIVWMYQRILQRICHYYSWENTPSSVSPIFNLLTKSCALTLADKFKLGSAQKVYKRFGPFLRVDKIAEEDFQKTKKRKQNISLHPSTYKKIGSFGHSGIPAIPRPFSSFFDFPFLEKRKGKSL